MLEVRQADILEDTIVQHSADLVGRWKGGNYYVTYELYEDRVITVDLVQNGEFAKRPENNPVREGFVFKNWYQVMEGGNLAGEPYGFNTVLTDDITLRAVWTHQHEDITFELWDSSSSLPDGEGSYCLTKDITLENGWTWNDGTLNLCLNGHTVTGNSSPDNPVLLINGGTLNIYDEEGGTVTQENARASTVIIGTNGTLNMYGGTITGGVDVPAQVKDLLLRDDLRLIQGRERDHASAVQRFLVCVIVGIHVEAVFRRRPLRRQVAQQIGIDPWLSLRCFALFADINARRQQAQGNNQADDSFHGLICLSVFYYTLPHPLSLIKKWHCRPLFLSGSEPGTLKEFPKAPGRETVGSVSSIHLEE